MPLFEYKCMDCGKTTEFFVRKASQKLACGCGSKNLEKQFSAFAVSEGSSNLPSGCADGSCGLPSSPCASGMCGLN